MARPGKSLVAHLREGTFRARRHHQLLAGPDVPWPGFALQQRRYRTATSEPERRDVARTCERDARIARDAADAEEAGNTTPRIDQELLRLGKAGSLKQLLAFFPHFLRHSKGPLCGQPFRLEPWQQNFLRELYRRDRDGRRIYRRAVLGVPHGNGKTALAAGLGLYELLRNPDSPEVYLAAGAKGQAEIGLDYARSFVEHGSLADWVSTGSTLRCPQRGGRMEALSSQGALQHGRAPSVALIDELGTFTTAKQQETYTALATAIHNRPDAYLLATTEAGTDPDCLLGRIYQEAIGCDEVTVSRNGCLTVAKNPKAGTLLWWYGGPADADPENPKTIRACNPASWISVADLQQQLRDPGLNEHDFRRHHLNQWPPTHTAPLGGGGGGRDRDGHVVTPRQLTDLVDELNRRYHQNE